MVRHSIVHVEIPAVDQQNTARFYKEVFGWDCGQSDETVPYTRFQSGSIGGGFTRLSGMYAPGEVLLYIDSDDLETDVQRIKSHGGKILMPRLDVPGFGSLALFIDPSGNRLALWEKSA